MDIKEINSTSFNSQKCSGWLPVVNMPGRAVGVLFGVFFIMLILVSVVSALLMGQDNAFSVKGIRILTIVQDILVFILPAILAAFVATRLPASLLTVNVRPRLFSVAMAIIILVTSMPAMELIIQWNNGIHLPESLRGIEEALRGMEEAASSSISALSGGNSVGDLIVSILIIGILTGIAEELFFRGALQNLFMTMPKVKKHFVIWAVAVIFSFMHFQFFGFIPRVLLGAYFGYLIWWTGSVWVPIIAHAFNNSMVVLVSWLAVGNGSADAIDGTASLTIGNDWITILLSVFVTILGIIIIRRDALRHRSHPL